MYIYIYIYIYNKVQTFQQIDLDLEGRSVIDALSMSSAEGFVKAWSRSDRRISLF